MKRSELRRIIREEYFNVVEKDALEKTGIDNIELSSTLNDYLDKFISVVQKMTASRAQELVVVNRILKGLNITSDELTLVLPELKVTATEGKRKVGVRISESEVTKELDNAVVGYQRLLKQKQDLIQQIKDVLAKEKDPKKKQDMIAKHNATIKKLNRQIEDAERHFIKAVDNIEAAEEDELH